jgi:hypothetical protein
MHKSHSYYLLPITKKELFEILIILLTFSYLKYTQMLII